VLDLLLPQRCLVCGAAGAQLCAGCRAQLPVIEPPLCERCGAPTVWPVRRCRECAGRRLAFVSARSAVAYDESVRRLVAGWKERGLRRFGDEAAALVAERLVRPQTAVVTFVPADRDRRLVRGYHPAERLAAALGVHWELPCEPLLARVRPSRRQRGLTLAERRRNVAGAFRATSPVPGAVLLVDDVYTSGATVGSAASALRAAGARRVEVVTFARALRAPAVGLGRVQRPT
jgi:predicted amidophosphoribosyltransferase